MNRRKIAETDYDLYMNTVGITQPADELEGVNAQLYSYATSSEEVETPEDLSSGIAESLADIDMNAIGEMSESLEDIEFNELTDPNFSIIGWEDIKDEEETDNDEGTVQE